MGLNGAVKMTKDEINIVLDIEKSLGEKANKLMNENTDNMSCVSYSKGFGDAIAVAVHAFMVGLGLREKVYINVPEGFGAENG